MECVSSAEEIKNTYNKSREADVRRGYGLAVFNLTLLLVSLFVGATLLFTKLS